MNVFQFFIIGQFIIINQNIRETDNRIERSPDFVTHIGKERLFQLSFQRQILGSGQFFLLTLIFLDVH